MSPRSILALIRSGATNGDHRWHHLAISQKSKIWASAVLGGVVVGSLIWGLGGIDHWHRWFLVCCGLAVGMAMAVDELGARRWSAAIGVGGLFGSLLPFLVQVLPIVFGGSTD